jgi:cytochrome c oxidase subunit 2
MRGVPLARLIGALLGLPALAAWGCGTSIESFDTVTDRGDSIVGLMNLILVLSVVVFVLVFALFAYAIVRFRDRPGAGEPSRVEDNRRLEITWTAIPLLLLAVVFVFFTVPTMRKVESGAENPLRIEVIGHQWWWEYRFPDLGVVTANELHVPVGEPLRFELTSADVIHNFWVPQFGWKKYNIPGQTNEMTMVVEEAGVYEGACTEFCLGPHAWMRIRVVAEPREEFDAWVRRLQQPPPAPTDSTAQRGWQLFLANTCVNCHAVSGTTAAATVGPNLTYLGLRATLGAGVVPNTPEDLARFILNADEVKPGVRMPRFDFTADEIAALVAYLEGLR